MNRLIIMLFFTGLISQGISQKSGTFDSEKPEFKKEVSSTKILVKDLPNSVSFKTWEVAENIEFFFFPNPASDRLTINLDVTNTVTRWALYDITGKKIKDGIFSVSELHQVDVNALNSGLYFIKVTNGDRIGTKKFFKK